MILDLDIDNKNLCQMWFTEYENQEFEAENEKFKQIQIQTFLLKSLEILPGDQLEWVCRSQWHLCLAILVLY